MMKSTFSTRLMAPMMALLMSVGSAVSHAAEVDQTFQQLSVRIEGKGQDMVFIPGLNSGKETFTDTCKAFAETYRCHLLQLPGFAGQPAMASHDNGFLPTMRDRIIAYIDQQQLQQPVLVGHSLGGVLSLMIALERPELAKALVIVDSLPFYPAIQNPSVTVDAMRPRAEQMRAGMLAQSIEDYQRNAQSQLQGMSNQKARLATLIEWSKTSDRVTTTEAMFDMMTLDLRSSIAQIKTPTLVLGAWAAYAPFGSTKESTHAIFASQYQQLAGVDIRLSDTAYHFISWDDPKWLQAQVTEFLSR